MNEASLHRWHPEAQNSDTDSEARAWLQVPLHSVQNMRNEIRN